MSEKLKSPIKSPQSPTLQDCDPQKNVLMKRNGWRGVIVAVVVVAIAVIIIVISKWNDIRQQRIPFVWRTRLKANIKDCANELHQAQEAAAPGTSYRHALRADAILTQVKKLVGTADLSKISGFDIPKIEAEIEAILRRNIPNSLLIKDRTEDDMMLKRKGTTNVPVGIEVENGPKRNVKKEGFSTLRDVAERYKLEVDESNKAS